MIELYVWPARWGLPSIDPASLSLIIYMQLVQPSKFVLVESVNPDLSPTGQLPFLKDGNEIIAPASSIISYLVDDKNGFDTLALKATFNPADAAWLAHAESNLGDLVFHMLYALHANWTELTHASIVYRFPVPQRYYVPHRLRQSYKRRLEGSGLWSLPGIEQETKHISKNRAPNEKVNPRDRFLKVFEREKVLEKARTTLDIYTRLLGEGTFFNGDQPSHLDAIVAAHILLLSRPPFPDPLLQDLVNTSYPSLVAHANRMYARTLSASLRTRDAAPDHESDVWETRLRFAFIGLTLGGIFTYLTAAISST
ncbi:outer mitochondrial membrane transport complex protein-domain-containing protein [Lentinula edodes]|uniref:outer mitochondrial membrane transport complex protein-domain-containing protein n=1 Tax=Lentinula edodes TaxID=5353 RepID=UPI001E8D0A37|nr:outer mitochondrial membrane transport complex protein-domain-containing protein [Lentinula edodes]KAH7871700.1 outer mitochondrial membrane transport complex protein-domain-containing protein [Lentinula edodes]